ncbi:hypothetical protein [Acaryochloris sp. CCMEE 5410]|nr:hypothetical protein [Acaryochloris sp. CCMEE 5410]
MTTPKIIGIAGGSGAGKTTLAQALVDRLSGHVHYFFVCTRMSNL